MATTIELTSPQVSATVSTTAAMLLDAAFEVAGRTLRPFARAPWVGADDLHGLPGHLRVLAAEFVAVPFGSSGPPASLDSEWAPFVPAGTPVRPHGRSADDDWQVTARGTDWITLTLDYPESDDISRLERTLRLRRNSAAIDFELVVRARRPTRTALGLHPILRLPSRPGDLEIEVEFGTGFTYPGTVLPGAGATRPASTFGALDAVPASGGGAVDLTRLPLGRPIEDIVLLTTVGAPLVARFHDDGAIVRLDWDRAVLPSLMLWLSDRALQERPWSGSYRGLGVEPVAAAFDLDNSVSVGANPLTRDGYVTAVKVRPDVPLRVRYSIEVGSHVL